MPLLQFLFAAFSKKPAVRAATAAAGAAPAASDVFSNPQLHSMSADLERAARLLLTPDVQSTQMVSWIVQDVGVRLRALNIDGADQRTWNELRGIQDQLQRTRRLAEGAMRIQWTSLRRLMALTQSYSPPGRISQYKDRWPRIDLKV
jgi:hypothetical protein